MPLPAPVYAPLPIPDLSPHLPDAARVVFCFQVIEETATDYAVRFGDRPSGVARLPKASARFLGLFPRAAGGCPCVLPAGEYRRMRRELVKIQPAMED